MQLSYDNFKSIYAEIAFMAKCNSPRIVQFFGVSLEEVH